jgi:hypothetical protein
MPTFRIKALEKFLVRTTYYVEAQSEKEAEILCKEGNVAYEDSETQEGDDEWIETLEVEEDENAAPEAAGVVLCSLCGKSVPAKTAHLHQNEWVGDECCWDERLRAGDE